MAEDREHLFGLGSGHARSWAGPVRKMVNRMLNGDLQLTDQPAVTTRADGTSCVVDCAGYVDGVRVPGRPDYAEALRTARRSDGFVWLGLHEPTETEFAEVARVFGLYELAIEQATTAHRPKIERYGDVTLFVLRTTRYVEHSELTETSEVVETGSMTVFLGPAFVITVRQGAPGALGPVRTDLEQRPDLLGQGPWAVAHAVCDRLVDTYQEVAAAMEADIDALEESVFSPRTRGRIAQIYQLKRELMEFKRAVGPLQRPLAALIDERELLPKDVRRYFRDVNDHLVRTVERVTAFDDLLNSLLQARLAQVTVEQNDDMRKIAAWAAIAAVQTLIAGIEGMNFKNMPELRWQYGYPGALVVMLVAAAVMYRMFRRSGWL